MSSGKGRYGPREKKTSIKNSIGRLLIFLALLIIQFYWVYNLLVNLDKKYPILSTVAEVLALFLVVVINENNSNVSMKVPFIILILAVPFMGVLLLILLEFSSNTWRIRRRFRDIDSNRNPDLGNDLSNDDEGGFS